MKKEVKSDKAEGCAATNDETMLFASAMRQCGGGAA